MHGIDDEKRRLLLGYLFLTLTINEDTMSTKSGIDFNKPFEVKQVFKLVQDAMLLKDRFKAA